MIYKKGSVDYEVNLETVHEMEEVVPMTSIERQYLRSWVKAGHDIDTNPFHLCELDGSSMNFLKARRIVFGASHGPWDTWEYASSALVPHNGKSYIRDDE